MKEIEMTRERMRADLAHILRIEPDEIGGDDDLADLGLDSLRAMNILLKWSKGGFEMDFGELSEKVTLDAWWGVAQRTMERAGHG